MARKKTPPEYGESPLRLVSCAVAVFVVRVATTAFPRRCCPTQGSKTYGTHDGGLPVELEA